MTTPRPDRDQQTDQPFSLNPISKRHFLTIMGQIDRHLHDLRSLVDKAPDTPTRSVGRPALSEEDRQRRLAERIRTVVIMRNFRQFDKYVRERKPEEKKDVRVAYPWAAKFRLVKELQQFPPIAPTDERYAEVLEEIGHVPFPVVLAWNKENRIIKPSPELDEAIAKHWVDQALPEKRPALEKAFIKRFGHRP